jgi:Ca2+-binding RTX toxin-like protein
MTIRVLLVSLLVASGVGPTVPVAAATATPAVRMVDDYSMVYFVAGTTVDDQVDRVSDGPGPAFADAVGTTVSATSGTSSVESRARNLAVLGPGEGSALLEIDAMSSITASATTDDAEAAGTPYASAWSVYSAEFNVTTTVPYTLAVDIGASSTDTNNCTVVKVWLTGPGRIVYDRTVGVGSVGWCGDTEEAGELTGSLTPGKYRLHLDVDGEVDDETAPSLTSAHAGVNLQLGRGCDNDPSAYGGRVQGTPADDVLCGGFGRDEIDSRGGDDLILAGPGNDEILAGAGDDAAYGAGGVDRLDGGEGLDVLAGGAGADVVTGGWGLDAIDGGVGDDVLAGGHSADRITGGSGADAVEAGPGDDTVRACDDTKDVLRGQRGADRVLRDPVDDIRGFETRTVC